VKCPHCGTGIHEGFAQGQFIAEPRITKGGTVAALQGWWTYDHQRCPECYKPIIILSHGLEDPGVMERFLAYPQHSSRPIPSEIVDPYRRDFIEACEVLSASPKASAALSRRCMQAVLRDKAQTTKKDLHDQIEEVIASNAVPSYIAQDLHAVRMIGNFAAHPLKSTNTGEILDVAAGEAEWNLDVLETLFDFYFVGPALSQKRKDELNKKLQEAGKPQIG
jgi:hypothetical protein